MTGTAGVNVTGYRDMAIRGARADGRERVTLLLAQTGQRPPCHPLIRGWT